MDTHNDNILKIQETSLTKGEQIVNMLEKFGLFWKVVKSPLFVADHSSDADQNSVLNTINDEGEPKSQIVKATDFYATQRDDNGYVFATVKKGYQVLQNWELCDLIQEVAGDFNLKVSHGGSLQRGGKVFIQIRTGTLEGIGENFDTIRKYITAINSHDASTSLGFGMTNTTISCSNTFHSAYKQLSSKIRHTMSMKEKLDILREELTHIQAEEETLYNMFMKMAGAPATTQDIKDVVMSATAVSLDTTEAEAKNLYSTQQTNKAKALTTRIAEEISVKGNTLWGLFSGVTKYTNRDLSVPNRENGTLESKFLGSANKLDNKVFDSLSAKLVEA